MLKEILLKLVFILILQMSEIYFRRMLLFCGSRAYQFSPHLLSTLKKCCVFYHVKVLKVLSREVNDKAGVVYSSSFNVFGHLLEHSDISFYNIISA